MKRGDYVIVRPIQSSKNNFYNVQLKGKIVKVLENTFIFETNNGLFLGRKGEEKIVKKEI